MGGKSGSSQQSQSVNAVDTSQNPWLPSQPILKGILSGIQGQLGNYQTNPTEQAALTSLLGNAQNVGNFGAQANDITGKFFGGDPSGLLNPALQSYNTAVSPIATGDLDPMKTPGIRNLLDTIRSDVSGSVNSQFAGAGRDLSGKNQEYLARGISAGYAAPLLNQYNQNVSNRMGAARGLYDAAGNTASALGANQQQGFNLATALPQVAAAGPMGVLSASNLARILPLQNLGMLENLTVPIAGLGSEGSQRGTASSNTQGTQTASPMQTALGWSNVFGNLFGGAASPVSNVLGAFRG